MTLSSLTQQQVEQLQDIGEALKACRCRQGVSLEDLATDLRIRARLLHAIEAGTAEHLPEAVFVQAFIRKYGDALGLDGQALAQEFQASAAPVVSNLLEPEEPVPTRRPVWIDSLLVVVSVAVIGGSAYYLLTRFDLPAWFAQSTEPAASSQDQQNTEPTDQPPEPSTAAGADLDPEPVVTPSPTQVVGVTVEASFQGDSWTAVYVDGKLDYEGTLTSGTKRTWSAKQEIRVNAGNAGAVLVSVNGQDAKPLGQQGAVEEVVFQASN